MTLFDINVNLPHSQPSNYLSLIV